MAAKNFISEDDIEQALLQRLQHLCGYNVLNCFTAQPDDLNDGSGRADKREVILAEPLRAALVRLNPQAPASAVDDAVATVMQPRTTMSLVAANRELITRFERKIQATLARIWGEEKVAGGVGSMK